MFYGPCLEDRGLVRNLWRFTGRFFYFPIPENTLPIFRADMKGCFLHGLLQETQKRGKRLFQKFNFPARISFWTKKKEKVLFFPLFTVENFGKSIPLNALLLWMHHSCRLHRQDVPHAHTHVHRKIRSHQKYACSHTHKQAENWFRELNIWHLRTWIVSYWAARRP